jgi:DNA anti-recombination protein RmuC
MSREKDVAGTQMAAIAEMIMNDVLATSDEAILAEAVEDGLDPAAKASELRSSALARIRQAKRERLTRARESYEKKSQVLTASTRPPLTEIKRRIQRAIQDGVANRLSLAFRNGQTLSDSDWEGLWDDMEEMGILDDGEPRD